MGDKLSLIGFLVQGSIFATTVRGLQWVLEDADAQPQMYRALLAELRALDINRDFVRVLQCERVFAITTGEWLRQKASLREVYKILTQMSGAPN